MLHSHSELKFRISKNIWHDLEVFVYAIRGDKIALAKPLQLETMTEEQAHVQNAPVVTLPKIAGQQLMDELWDAGLRPSEGTGSAGSLAATERHLADMRAIVFKQTPAK